MRNNATTSTVTTGHRFRTLLAALATLVLAGIMLLSAGVEPAQAQTSYSVENWTGCGGGYNSGSYDDAGNLYIPCGNPSTIRVYDPAGQLQRQISLGFFVSDVAPSPDGQFLYTASGDATPRRLNRQADGSYALDANWRLASYPMYGQQTTPRGHFIATDGAGNIYLADGAWSSSNAHTVIKYAAGGAFVTRFGEYEANSWSDGKFYWMLTGLAVSPDGSKVYTTEAGNNRVQRFDRQLDGSYTFAWRFGGTPENNPDRGGYCRFDGWEGKFAAPYDVALDGAGYLYVMNTTCHQVLKFTAAGAYITGAQLGTDATSDRPHGFAVAKNGNVYIGQSAKKMVLLGGDTTPPDTLIDSGPAEGSTTSTTSASFAFHSSEVGSSFECSLDSAPFAACASPKDYANLPAGSHTFKVRAIDAAGNVDLTPASRTWTVSTTTATQSCQGKAATTSITKTTKADGTVVLTGTEGADVIVGSPGNDQIFAKGGDDTVCAADGFDTISGGAGNDALDGGLGADAIEYGSSLSAVNVDLATGRATGEGTDTISSFTEVYGSPQPDTLVGDGAANFLAGNAGDDKLSGGGANDKLYGGDGYDYLKGNAGTDTLDGQLGGGNADYSDAPAAVSVNLTTTTANEDILKNLNDITGSRFDDTLVGNAMSNWLVGGAGADKLSGMDANDTLTSRDGISGNDSLDGGAGTTDKGVTDATELSIVGCESVVRPV